jgi:HEAT repeat protein
MATIDEIRSALDSEEPDYDSLAKELGAEALPHLRALVVRESPLLASKATYLAGMIGGELAAPVVQEAASSADATVRVAAAAAAAMLSESDASDVLVSLVDDADTGVQRVALRSVPANPSADLYSRVEALGAADTSDTIRKETIRTIERVTKRKE